MTEPQAEPTDERWNADPLTNYPVGPDDAGNGVMVGIGFLVSGWRWVTGKFRGDPGPDA